MTQPRDPSTFHRMTADTKGAKLIRPKPGKAVPTEPGVVGPVSDFGGWFIPSPPYLAYPGYNTVTIPFATLPGIGAVGTPWIVSGFVTEIIPPNTPHVGAALISTLGIQMDQAAEFASAFYILQWQWPLPVGLMLILGVT